MMLSSLGPAVSKRLLSSIITRSSGRTLVIRLAVNKSIQIHSSVSLDSRLTRSFATTGRPNSTPRTAKTTKAVPKKKTAVERARPKSKKAEQVKAKAKPKAKRTPKALSPESKARLDRVTLRNQALFNEPKGLPENPYRIYTQKQLGGVSVGSTPLATRIRGVADSYKALTASERQRLNDVAEQHKRSNAAAYKAWVESHSPAEIHLAQKARAQLKRKYNIPKGSVKKIHDERMPKRPASSFSLFTRARWASGDLSNLAVVDASKTIAGEWKGLSSVERQPYVDLSKASIDSYHKGIDSIKP